MTKYCAQEMSYAGHSWVGVDANGVRQSFWCPGLKPRDTVQAPATIDAHVSGVWETVPR